MKTNKTLSIIITMFISIFILLGLTNKTAVAEDTTPPTVVSVTGDTAGTTGETVTLTAVVEDDLGVTEVVFNIGTQVETAETATRVPQAQGVQNEYKVVIRIPSNSIDDIPYYVEASDAAGNTVRAPEEGTYTITVTDNDAPTVTVISPNGGEVAGIKTRYDILWTAEDNIGVSSINLFYSTNSGASWKEIKKGEDNDGLYEWTVPDDATTTALVKVVATDGAGNSGEDVSDGVFTIKFITVSFPFFDDFESGLKNWEVTGSWGVTEESAKSGTKSLTDSPMTLYGNNVNTYAQFKINLVGSTRPLLTFWERHNLASGDYVYVEFSKDGSNWDRVYYQVGTNPDWKQQQIDLRRYAGESKVYIRFRIQTDGSAVNDGWYIDDVSVDENTATVAFPFFDDMESPDSENNWIASNWRRTSTSGHSGTSSWRIDTSGSNPDSSNIWLTLSAPLDLSKVAKPQLVFWHRYNLSAYYGYDYAYVYVSTDGGKNFTQITYYYNGTQSSFTRVQLDLSSYAGSSQVVIGFMFYWNRGNPSSYWEIDDVAIDSAADPVLLHTPKNATQHSLDLSWAKSVTSNFAYYALYRCTNPSGSWQWVTSIDDINTTQYTDDTLELRRTYYYIIYVVKPGDVYGVASNETFGTTLGVGYPFSDDFENGVANWDVKPPWNVTTEEAHGGDYSLTDSPMTLYGNNINTYVTTGLNLSGSRRPILTFWEIYNLASGDFVYVEISKDNEVSWDRVYFQVGTNLTWTKRQIDLRRYVGESQVRIRFRIQTDGSAIQDGWYIDDVSITEYTTTVAFPFFDDMETADSENNWIASNWRRTSTSGHSGTSSWRIDTSGSNPDNSDILLTLSAPLDLRAVANPQLVFWHRYKLSGYYDYGRVYISTDGGKNFTQLTYYYNGTQSSFTRVQLDLSPYAGSSQVVIGFMFDGDRYDPSDFWEIDDVAIDSAADPILLHTPKNATKHSLDLSWAKSVTSNFAYYALYRCTNPSGSWQWVTSIDDINTTQYTDDTLELRRTYYYIIYVVKPGDVYGVASNETFGTTLGVGYPFSDDFENGVANWDVKPPWNVTTEEAHGGDYSLTDSPMTLYGNNINTYVTTGLNLSGSRRPILTFWEIYNLASGDFVYVEISKDNEVSWDRVYFQVGTNLTWTKRQIDLRRYVGESQVRIRFRIQTDGSAIQDGWYIDDVSITEYTTTVAFPFFDDMETADSENNWIASNWRRTSTSGHSGTSSWRIDTSGSNPDNSDILLTLSAPLDLRAVANPQLVFWHRYKLSGYYDYGRVYISTDGGKNFTQLTYYYNGTQSSFTRVQLDLSPYAGSSQVVIGFMFDGDRYDPSDFWEIDDVAITEPSVMVDFGQLDSPSSITVNPGTPTGSIYGLVYEVSVTDKAGQGGGIIAQLGYGPDGSIPDDGWTWVDATYDSDVDGEPGDKKFDRYRATLTIGQSGVYDYAYRYRLEISSIWIYADLDGSDLGSGGFNGYSPSKAGDLKVGDGTKPIIANLSPSIGPVGTPVTITGENFGDSQDGSTVTFNGIDAGSADSWSDTTIKIKVPEGATTGPVVVTVGGQASNDDKIFTVGEEPLCAFADIDGDGDVDIVDIQKVAGRWGTKLGDPDYVPEYDIDGDGDIDIVDIQKVAGCWGTVLPSATGAVVINQPDLDSTYPVQISIQPQLQKFTISETAMIEVKISNVSNVGAFEFTLRYDTKVVQVSRASDVILGDFLSSTGRMIAVAGSNINNEHGAFSYGAYSYGEDDGPSGEGILVQIPLKAVGFGHTALELAAVQVTDTDGNLIPVSTVNGSVNTTPDYGDVSGNGEVTAYDAALVLQRVVGLIAPDDENFPYLTLATADVTGDGTISALDAAYILKYSVKLIDQFPVQEQSSSPMRNPLVTASKLSVADVSAKPGDRVIVPIKLEHARDALALQFTVSYDARILKFIRVAFSTLTENSKESAASVTSNNAPDGTLNVALATATDMVETGEIIHLEFDVLMTPAGYASPLELVDVYLNEGVTPQVKHGSVKILPNRMALLQNYPNPFNPETWIPYQLSRSAEVSISIYSISGRLVRHLELGRKEAGFYTSRSDAAYWDGRNKLGEKVSSGVYFYHLKADDFQATRKLLVTK